MGQCRKVIMNLSFPTLPPSLFWIQTVSLRIVFCYSHAQFLTQKQCNACFSLLKKINEAQSTMYFSVCENNCLLKSVWLFQASEIHLFFPDHGIFIFIYVCVQRMNKMKCVPDTIHGHHKNPCQYVLSSVFSPQKVQNRISDKRAEHWLKN